MCLSVRQLAPLLITFGLMLSAWLRLGSHLLVILGAGHTPFRMRNAYRQKQV